MNFRLAKLLWAFIEDALPKRQLFFYEEDGFDIPAGKVLRLTLDYIDKSEVEQC